MGIQDPGSRLAARMAFVVRGSGLACWAPLVPFAEARLGVNEGWLVLLLHRILCSYGVGDVGMEAKWMFRRHMLSKLLG